MKVLLPLALTVVVAVIAFGTLVTVRPGWAALDRVYTIHHVFEIGGWIALGLLLFMEAGALVYGGRRAELEKGASDRALALVRAEAEGRIADARAEAERRAAALDAKYAPRKLSPSQLQALQEVARAGAGRRVSLARPLGDGEAKAFSTSIRDALVAAGWQIEDEHDAVFGPPEPVGLQIQISDSLALVPGPPGTTSQVPMEKIPREVFLLKAALEKAGLEVNLGLGKMKSPGSVSLIVGHKAVD